MAARRSSSALSDFQAQQPRICGALLPTLAGPRRFSFLLPAETRSKALVATCQALVGFCCWSLGFQDRQWVDVKDFEYDAEHTSLAKSGPHTSGEPSWEWPGPLGASGECGSF